jgi:hypothetical protein
MDVNVELKDVNREYDRLGQRKYQINGLKKEGCLVRLYLQMRVGGLVSYLRHLCLFAHSGVQHIYCVVF